VHKAFINIVLAGSAVFINLATSICIVTVCNKAKNHMLWAIDIESQLVFNTGCIVSTHTHTLHNSKFKCSYDRSKQIVITRNTKQR